MDLLVLIIEQFVKAFKQTPAGFEAPASNPNDLVRQIQARIEAARTQQSPAAKPGRPVAQARPPARKVPGIFKQRKTKRKAPPALPPTLFDPPAQRIEPVAAAIAAPLQRPTVAASVNAKTLAAFLRPQSLRSQFILTEIFQPPIALRETHLS